MKIKPDSKKSPIDAAFLRQKAEELLKEKLFKTDLQLHEADAQKLIHELEVHQIELELQNEELILAKEQAEVASQKYAELYDFAPSGYFTLSKEGKIIELNLNGANMFGKERSLLINSMFGFFVSNETKPIFNRFLRKVFTGEANESCEVALITKDNSPMYVQLTGIADQNGGQCLVTIADITAQKQAFELVEKSNRQKNLILEAAGEGILGIDLAGNLTFINPMAAEILGYCVEELPFKNSHELFHHHHRDGSIYPPEDCPIYSTLRSGKLAFGEEIFVRKNGTYFPVEFTSLPVLENGEITGAVVTFRDITDRKHAEVALRDSEHRYRLLIETVHEGILVAQNGFLKFTNPMMQVITDFTQEELLTRPFIEYVYPDDRKILINNHLKRLKGEQFLPRYQFRIVKKDGSTRSIEMNGIVIEWEGQPATLNLLTDITERKQAEEEIQLINEQLLKLNAEKDKFFSIIAHDLRSPFNGFLGLTQVMAEELSDLTMEEIQNIAVSMSKSATNLYRLLENLLQWARMQQGSIPFNPELLQLLQVVEECITITIEQAKNKGVEITYHVADDTKVFADSNMLQTIMRNLVSNAVKFTPKGGKIYVSVVTTEDKSVEISIKDTGIGMTGEMISNLFRLDAKTNRKGTNGEPSSGIGLLLCKEFVEKLGGRIWVESEVGKGTTFYFSLPNM